MVEGTATSHRVAHTSTMYGRHIQSHVRDPRSEQGNALTVEVVQNVEGRDDGPAAHTGW